MFTNRLFKFTKTISYSFCTRYNQPNYTSAPLNIQRRQYFADVKRFTSALLSTKTQQQLIYMYLNRNDLSPKHHSIVFHKLTQYYKMNPPQNYQTKDMLMIISNIEQELEDFDPQSLVNILLSLCQFPKKQHYSFLNLQNKIINIFLDEESYIGLDRITVLKLMFCCRKLDRFESEHDKILQVIKLCLRKSSNSIKKFSTRNIINAIHLIEEYKIITNNTLRAYCKQAINREYLEPEQKVILLKGIVFLKSKEMIKILLGEMKPENLKQSNLNSIYELNQLLAVIDHNQDINSQKDNIQSKLVDYEIFFIKQALQRYQNMFVDKQLISLPYLEETLKLCEKHNLEKQLSQLFSIVTLNSENIKVQNKLVLYLYQLRHGLQPNSLLLKTTERKVRNMYPYLIQILKFPETHLSYDTNPKFQYLTNLSLRYFLHNIFKFSHSQQLSICQTFSRLFSKSSLAFETYIKLVGKYLVDHSRYSQDTIDYMSQKSKQISTKHKSYLSIIQQQQDAKAISIIQKMTAMVNLLYYTIVICEGMNKINPEHIKANTIILQEVRKQFTKNFRLGYYKYLTTQQIIARLGAIQGYYKSSFLTIEGLQQYFDEENQNNKQELIKNMQGEIKVNVVVRGVKLDVLNNNTGYIITKQQGLNQLMTLQKLLLKQKGIELQYIQQ